MHRHAGACPWSSISTPRCNILADAMMTLWRMLQTTTIWSGLVLANTEIVNFAVETGLDVNTPGARLWYISNPVPCTGSNLIR
jgi:hypothetical protein